MNNLECDSKKYDVLVMETSTQEKTVRDTDWCVPVEHVAKLSRMRGSTSTKTNIKFFVDPEEEDRDNDTTPDCLGSKQFALEDNVSYKCSCCEANGMQWKRTQKSPHQEAKCTFSQPDRCRHQFSSRRAQLRTCASFNKNTWAPLPKPLVVDSGAGETVMPVDWLTRSHPLTEPDGSRANDFYTTADGSKVHNEGQRKLEVCTHDGQQRKIHDFSSCQSEKGSGTSKSNGKEREQSCFWTKVAVEKTRLTTIWLRRGKRCVRLGI